MRPVALNASCPFRFAKQVPAGPRSGQDTQAPRSGQDVQAPRSGQDTQAPRGQDTQAPRAVAGAKASSGDAAKLVREAEAACKAGNMGAAKAKAIEAMSILK